MCIQKLIFSHCLMTACGMISCISTHQHHIFVWYKTFNICWPVRKMGFPPQLPHIGLLKYSSGLFQPAIEAQIFFSWKMSLNFLGPSIWFGKICLCPRTTHSRFFVSRYDCQIFNICCGTIGTLATSDNRFSRRIWRTKFVRSGHNILCISSL